MEFAKLDAAETVFFARELEQVRARSYDIKYAAFKGLSFVPVDTSLDPATELITYQQWDQVGMAKLIASYATDFPRSEVFAREFTAKIKSYGAGYGYNVQEIRAARLAGKPLEQKRASAAKRAVDQKLDLIAQTGDSDAGFKGLLNLANTDSYTIPADGDSNGGTSSKKWAHKTAEQILRDLHTAVRTMVETTKEVEQPDTIIMPLSSFGFISTTRANTFTDATILDVFLKMSPYITTVASWYALETAGGLSPSATQTASRMVVYRRDPDVLQFLLPLPFEQFPPQEVGMEFQIACHARCGGVVAYYPKAILYADGF